MKQGLTVIVAIVLAGGCQQWGETNQRGLDAEKQAKQIAASSPFQKPSDAVVVAAVRQFEGAKGEVQTVDVISLTQQDQFDKYVVKARVNGVVS